MSDRDSPQPSPQTDLRARILAWMQSEGYPLEFKTATAFREAGFRVRQGDYSDATQTDPPREIDVRATVTDEPHLRVEHLVECKWSRDKPWVLFCSGSGMATTAVVAQTIGSSFGETLLRQEARDQRLAGLALFGSARESAFGGRQAFAKGKDLLYDSLRAIVETCRRVADEHDRYGGYSEDEQYAVVAFPVIVVDGELFEARQREADVVLTEVEQSRVHWRGSETNRHPFATVDIVQAKVVEDFARERATESRILLEVLKGARAQRGRGGDS